MSITIKSPEQILVMLTESDERDGVAIGLAVAPADTGAGIGADGPGTHDAGRSTGPLIAGPPTPPRARERPRPPSPPTRARPAGRAADG